MKKITQLPDRPLRQEDIHALDAADGLQVAPYGGIADDEGMRIYAVKLAVKSTAHALAFDDVLEQWKHLALTDASNLETADSRLDAVLDECVQEWYSERFEVLKPV